MPGVGSGFLNAGLGREPQEAEPSEELRGLGPASTDAGPRPPIFRGWARTPGSHPGLGLRRRCAAWHPSS